MQKYNFIMNRQHLFAKNSDYSSSLGHNSSQSPIARESFPNELGMSPQWRGRESAMQQNDKTVNPLHHYNITSLHKRFSCFSDRGGQMIF